MIVRAQYGKLDYSAVPKLLHAAEEMGFHATDVRVEQNPSGSHVIATFLYRQPEDN